MADDNQTIGIKWYGAGLKEKDLEGLTKVYANVLLANVFPLCDAINDKQSTEQARLKMSFRTESGQHLKFESPTSFQNLIRLRELARYNINDLEGKVCELYLKDDVVKEVCVNVYLLP
jgi:hypothetical protein